MKRRRLLLSLPHLPTITETLEDLPVHPSSSQCTQGAQSLEDYMSSIQALACPSEPPSCGPVRLQRSPRLRQFSKAQMKLSVSASLPRGSPRTLRTSKPSSLGLSSTEDLHSIILATLLPVVHYKIKTSTWLGLHNTNIQ
uniref:Uncharacterized protein n=1 Tax=Echeneis naucrates TaxID=173247 RepID=A0A665UI00_ECHNA